ncbi:TfoX/Sxy family protein [Nonomuraea basaltis]|uniref:TfoX/Sxy family protein n=1 Tax=Nonomuraea basaltis TaxID=2495887 RepID=UPI00110C6D44|nr:TfoX/Sxy family protein [Nonomuraea basaltis]TMR91050.1 TfoX/Sxy family protein [Nonomuraea basaltis]
MSDRREAPDRDLLDQVAESFTGERDVAVGTMFRSPGLRVGGKIFAFLGHHGQLIVKLPSDRADEFVEAGTAEKVVMGKRTMREWIAFPAREDRAATLTLWRNVAQEAHQYVGSLRQPS